MQITNKRNSFLDLEQIKNWEEKDGMAYITEIKAKPTLLWNDGWYKNPSSGRSYNYGINTHNPQEHSTVIVKGGSFFVDKKMKNFFLKNNINLNELYGGISFEMAQKEYNIACLIQDQFKLLLNKKANCPEPIDVKTTPYILHKKNNVLELFDFFQIAIQKEDGRLGKLGFTNINLLQSALALGIDIYYPMSEEASEDIKRKPFSWVYKQYLEKSQQSVYRYRVEGPNTRILDLMIMDFSARKWYFMKANNANNINDALYKFSSKLGEFYGVLHKSSIGYHAGYSEHCTLIDTTISGVVMDIGGLFKTEHSDETRIKQSISKLLAEFTGKPVAPESSKPSSGIREAYLVQILKTTNLISYVCKNIFKTENGVIKNALRVFWDSYKSVYLDEQIEYISQIKEELFFPEKIRTRYLDHINVGQISLASDLKHLFCE